jgi:RNA polymerase sigma factor (sigma-70 family)
MQETKLKLLERIVDRRQDSLYRFAYFRTGSQADAEDIVQDVLLRLFHSDCNLDRIDDVERYLWRAIANRCCDYHRHRRKCDAADRTGRRTCGRLRRSGTPRRIRTNRRAARNPPGRTGRSDPPENLRLPDFRPDRRAHRQHRGDRQIPFPLRDRQAPQTHKPLKIIRHEMHRF